MDTQAPTQVTMNLNGYSSGAWTNGNVTQTASASDNVGIAYYQYTHDGSSVATFPNPWTINWDGQWNFYVRAVDYAGNAGAWSNVYTIRRDATAPSTPSILINEPTVNTGNWSFSIGTGGSSDNLSGINRYEYKINGSWTSNPSSSGTGWFSTNDYGHCQVRAIDNAGNASYSENIYLNPRRLYIRQLYYSMRDYDGWIIREAEVDEWDYQQNGHYAPNGPWLAVGIVCSDEYGRVFTNKGPGGLDERLFRGILGRGGNSGGSFYNHFSNYWWSNRKEVVKLYVNSSEGQNLYSNRGLGAGTI